LLKETEKKINHTFKENTDVLVLQTDIRQMFTNLEHNHIRRAIQWLLAKNDKLCARKTRKKPYINISTCKDDNGKHVIYWSSVKGSCGWRTLDIPSLLEIVDIDLDNTFQSVGGMILKQKFGCPIGGNLSAIYANILCAFDENTILNTWKNDRKLLSGIRQVDDLILFIAYDKTKPQTKNKAAEIKEKILTKNHVYRGGLELVEQKPLSEGTYFTLCKFAGTKILITRKSRIIIDCQPLQKNEQSLLEGKETIFPRFIHKSSADPPSHKKSCLIGTLFRLVSQTTSERFFRYALYITFLEFSKLGFSKKFFRDTLFYVAEKKKGLKKLIYYLDKW
jgi:hypothetical protein